MEKNRWVCQRCGNEFDLDAGEGWVRLVEDEESLGKLNDVVAFETVCYDCADELYAVVEKCDKNCIECDVTTLWGLSIAECLKFQLKFEVIDLPQKPQPARGSLEEAKEVLAIFNTPLWFVGRK